MIRRWLIRLVAIISIAVCVAVSVVDVARGLPQGGYTVLYALLSAVFVVFGWLIAERQPSNVIGPLLLLFGACFACYLPADMYIHLEGHQPAGEFAALFISLLDAPMFILIAFVLILFPDGRLPSPRWRWAIAAGVLGIGMTIAGYLIQAGPFELFPAYRNPFGIEGIASRNLVYGAYAILLVLLVLGAVALVGRWRRGNPVERAQIKWMAAAAVVLVATEIVNVATFDPDEPSALATVLVSVGITLVPIVIAVAVLRYRLYDIDRLISRTLSYAVVTAILGTVFVGVILVLQTVLSGIIGKGGIPVAISTLAVFALFQPVLRRVRRTVDRRFDRARYDGERTAGEFAERLRWETDMDRVSGDLRTTVTSAVAPSSLAVWLRAGRTTR
jgi:hypothetical protein